MARIAATRSNISITAATVPHDHEWSNNIGRLRLCLLTLLFLAIGPSPAHAQSDCTADRDAMLETLHERFGEHPLLNGIRANGNILELYVGPDRSWTIIIIGPTGLTCVAAAGTDLEIIPFPIEERSL